MTATIETKLSEAKRVPRSRIWLQGARLTEHGFNPGAFFQKFWGKGKLTLVAIGSWTADELPKADRGKISGNAERPVIDIVGQKVADTFKGTHVKARFTQGRITITD